MYIALSFTKSFIEILSLKPPKNSVHKKLLNFPILYWGIIEDEWLAQVHRAVEAWCPVILCLAQCMCSVMEAKPTSRKSEWSPLHLGWCDWSKNSVAKSSLALTHHSWHVGSSSIGQQGHFWPPLLAGMRCPLQTTALLSCSGTLCCCPTCPSVWLQGCSRPSPESHLLNGTSCPFSLWMCGHYWQHSALWNYLDQVSLAFLSLSFPICKLGIVILSLFHGSWEPVWPICLTQGIEALDWRINDLISSYL